MCTRAVSSFDKLNRIGQGTYSVVYRARDQRSGEIVALKRVIMHNEQADGFPVTSLREIRLLKRLVHPNIVRLQEIAVGRSREAVFLVFEYSEHDLARLMDSMDTPFTEGEAKCIVRQLLSAIGYLHSHCVLHRDVKMSNVLYDRAGQVKLADFGLARQIGVPKRALTPKVVTLWYRPPELLLGQRDYGYAVDMWGVGCIYGELLEHAPLLPGRTEQEQLREHIFPLLGFPTETSWPGWTQLPNAPHMSRTPMDARPHPSIGARFKRLGPEGLRFMRSMLCLDPRRRATAAAALNDDRYWNALPRIQTCAMMPSFPSLHTMPNFDATSKRRIKAPRRRNPHGADSRFGDAFDSAAQGPQRAGKRQRRDQS
jgi:cyclin-dependent kinase 10